MPILERTPPQRRPLDGVESRLDSSPSQARHNRSVEKRANAASNGGDYIFPSLDAMAAPVRERNAAMTYSRSWTPTLSTQFNGSGRKEFGSLGSGSGRKLSSLNGRNAPLKTATAGSMYPSLGETSTASSSRSPHKTNKRESIMTQRPEDASTSEVVPKVYPSIPQVDNDDRPIRGVNNFTDAEIDDDRKAFEAQMEKALASGANPFQDKKRDQMRDESGRISTMHHEEEQKTGKGHTSSSSTPRLKPAIAEPEVQQKYMSPLRDRSSPPSQFMRSTRVSTAPIQASPKIIQTARIEFREIQEKEATIATLQDELVDKQKLILEMQTTTRITQNRLIENEKITKEQEARIAILNSKLQRVKTAPKEQPLEDLTSSALSWELSRVKCHHECNRVSEIRQRDLEAIIYRNEVTYMESRRAEADLQIQMQHLKIEELELALRKQHKQVQILEGTLGSVEKSRDELGEVCRDLEIREAELVAEVDAERLQREAAESESRRWEQEIKAIRAREEEQRKELNRKERAPSAAKRPIQSPISKIATREVSSSPPKKSVAATATKVKGTTSEQLRQSPRKQVMEKAKAVVAKGVKRKSSVSLPSDKDIEENGQQSMSFDADIAYKKPVKATMSTKKNSTKWVVEVPPSEGINKPSEEEEAAYVEPVKKTTKKTVKKGSLLDRGKAAAAMKKSATIKKIEAETEPIEEEMDVEKTPMMPSKKISSRQKQVKAAVPDDSFNVDATPILQAKTKRQSKEEIRVNQRHQQSVVVTSEDEEIENITPVVPSKRGIAQDDKAMSNKTIPAQEVTTTTEVKKKKRRLLKPTTNIANGFLNINGDGEGDLDPKLNLPLQLSPLKEDVYPTSSSSSTLLSRRGNGGGSLTAAASRLFGR